VILGVYPIFRHTQSVLVEFHVTSFWCLLWVAILAMQTSTFFSRFAAWKIGDWATSRVVTHAMHLAYLSVNGVIKDFEPPTQWPLQLEISDLFCKYIYIYIYYIFIYIFIKLFILLYIYVIIYLLYIYIHLYVYTYIGFRMILHDLAKNYYSIQAYCSQVAWVSLVEVTQPTKENSDSDPEFFAEEKSVTWQSGGWAM